MVSLLVINVSYEFLRFGVWIVKIPFSQFADRIVASDLIFIRLLYEAVLRQIFSQSTSNMSPGRGSIPVLLTKSQTDRFRRQRESDAIEQLEDIVISLRHPRYHWR
ncbi:hypothetical protein C492_11535 [Natronococcus jeotgali DSM 18795]|uniref:Uncharacterized protein n=1 Tax=Natronococcus jeotgali DSM 18795 TaxID=1227498 RepID=L9XDY4_9EURY|nr:hypothetical protein C492_11535 [Natronococcus jeotgali DSM 18795]